MIRPLPLSLVACFCLGACTSTPSGPIERPDDHWISCDPYTHVARYRVDSVVLPTTDDEARADAFDLYDQPDGGVDDQLGQVLAAVTGQLTAYQPEASANAALAGALDWELATETCDATGETRVRLGSFGGSPLRADGDVDSSGELYAQNGCAEVPVGALGGGAAPGWVLANQFDAQLAISASDISGTVGFALSAPDTSNAYAIAMAPFLTAQLGSDEGLLMQFDANGDGTITPAELQATPLYQSLLASDSPAPPDAAPEFDVTCPPGVDTWMSFGLQLHATVLPN